MDNLELQKEKSQGAPSLGEILNQSFERLSIIFASFKNLV